VIGGGVAGLEAANVFSQRGHRVTVFEGESRLGGMFRRASMAPGKHTYLNVIINSLTDLVAVKPADKRITVSFDLTDSGACVSDPKSIGYFLLDALYDFLGIYDDLGIR
jgi:NADPH-dependent 2,4-dienoyl-CoA reductase/sulfur reductase-like enzyme